MNSTGKQLAKIPANINNNKTFVDLFVKYSQYYQIL